MIDLTEHLDEYTRKARLYPALLVTTPVVAAVLLLWPGLSLEKLLPVVAAAGLPFFASNLVRDRGKLLEDHLVSRWGGMPTTRLLRIRETTNNRDQLQIRRQKLEALLEQPLPTAAEERDDPQRSDERYVFATRTLIARVRQERDRHPLLHTENVAYGFRRNLLAVKPIAVTLLFLLLGADIAALPLGRDPQLVGAAITVHVVILVIWFTAVRSGWVMRQGNSYAERLFDTLEDPQITHHPPNDQDASHEL
jgi:hypothetical protein